ncbi:hypothetical protein L7F22_046431 [Adiantum nelumboides]|nr:hypothetical protein [Adiantum nelumboides]
MFFWDLAVHSEQSINEILPKLAAFSWWENRRNIEWNEHENFSFYITLEAAARRWNKELIAWLFDEWKVSLKPPSTYQWKGSSIADVVAMGKHVDEEVFKDLGDAEGDHGYWYYSKKYFDRMASGRWMDGQCSSLIRTLEPLIYKKSHQYPKNKWFEALCEKDCEPRLEVLVLFAKNYKDPGAESFALPRLDLVVACGQLQIFKWFIDNCYIDLNLPLFSDEEMNVLEEGDLNNDDVASNDDLCAICYNVKKFPVELQCGHSYCLLCICKVRTYLHANMQSFQCPYCHRHVSIPPSMTISSSLQYHLESESPWLQYQPSNTLVEILMALAAGTGSVFILEYLITQHNMDPLTTLYANGQNLMHLAASRFNFLSCKWLCLNGYLKIATCLSNGNLSPVHEAINNSKYAASLIFDLFFEHKVLPYNWIDLAIASSNAGIVHSAECALSHVFTAAISYLLSVNADLDQLICVIDKSTFGKCHIFDDNVINSQLECIIQCGRVDVLIWLYNSDIGRQLTYFNRECREFIWKKIGKLHLSRRAMEAFMEDVEAAEKLKLEISKCNSRFHKLIVGGAPIIEIENTINSQKEMIKNSQNLNLKVSYISFDHIVGHGLKPLKMTVHHGHLHLIDWILKIPGTDLTETVSQTFSQAIGEGNIIVFQFTLSWLDANNQPLPTSILMCRKNRGSLLHAVVSFFVITTSTFMPSEAEAKIFRDCFEMVQILVDRPDVDLNALNEEQQTALFDLACIFPFGSGREGFLESAEITADYAFKLIQMLIIAGTDLYHVDVNNRTFFETVLEKGSPLLIKAIRWLVLEKGVDIQFVQFSCFSFDQNVCDRVVAEFNAIGKEQRLLFQSQER